jgi:cytochrome b subunit of formate dehydrogenase
MSEEMKINRIKNSIFMVRENKYFSLLYILFFLFTSLMLEVKAQEKEDCLMCHSDKEMTMEKDGKNISIFVNDNVLNQSTHSKLRCVSCHVGFDPEAIPHKEKIEPVACVNCHKNALVKHQFHPQILRSDRKNDAPAVSCKNCHGEHDVLPIHSPRSPYNSKNLFESCGKCHENVSKNYAHSIHHVSFQNDIKGAPNCLTCHKTRISTSYVRQDSLQGKIAQEKLCLSCHLDNPDVRVRMAPTESFILAYENSVHGQALMKGDPKAANCVDCHTSHDILKGSDEKSSVYKFNVVETCAKCHSTIAKEYKESIHGKALEKRHLDTPTCTDCHGEHNILHPSDPRAHVSFRNVSTHVCSPCHSSVKLSDKYGLSTKNPATFRASYHGLALRGGDTEAANCASCHGYHNIKPSSDSTSTIHKANIVKTCGKCHPGANELFAIGAVHVTLEKEEEPILYWIATIYLVIIFTAVGGMFFHNFLDFIKKAKKRKMIQRGVIRVEHHGHRLYLRMTLNERLQHIALLLSFFTLVITGFMLRFPDAWWVRFIHDIFPDYFIYRSLLHRVAAVVMIAASVYHVFYLSAAERGRQLFKDLLPKYNNLRDAIGVMKYNLGFSKEKPKLDRFSYVEKIEYWAMVWGTIIMTITGFIMWFENYFIGIFTKLGWDIARTIHYYEAWLAFLAIIVWHFYFVIFNPDIYPMNLSWVRGTLSEEEMMDEHPAELDRIKRQEKESGKSEIG